jgi:hypothetical protein
LNLPPQTVQVGLGGAAFGNEWRVRHIQSLRLGRPLRRGQRRDRPDVGTRYGSFIRNCSLRSSTPKAAQRTLVCLL